MMLTAVWCCSAVAQTGLRSASARNIYSNASLAFQYRHPLGMHDKTDRFRSQIRQQAKARRTTKTLTALLAISSGTDDKDPSWHSLTIETCPRNAVSEPDDAKAEARMSAWVADSRDASALPRSVIISGQSFSVFLLGSQEGTVTEGAVVWTTVRKGKLLSFAFVANSPDQIKTLTESMKSLQFF